MARVLWWEVCAICNHCRNQYDAGKTHGPHGSTRQWAQPIHLDQFFGPSPPILAYSEFYLFIYVLSCI